MELVPKQSKYHKCLFAQETVIQKPVVMEKHSAWIAGIRGHLGRWATVLPGEPVYKEVKTKKKVQEKFVHQAARSKHAFDLEFLVKI